MQKYQDLGDLEDPRRNFIGCYSPQNSVHPVDYDFGGSFNLSPPRIKTDDGQYDIGHADSGTLFERCTSYNETIFTLEGCNHFENNSSETCTCKNDSTKKEGL